VFLHSLKLTVEASLWGIFSIANMVTLLLPTSIQWQNLRDGWAWIELFVGMGSDGSESQWVWVAMGLKSHLRAHL